MIRVPDDRIEWMWLHIKNQLRHLFSVVTEKFRMGIAFHHFRHPLTQLSPTQYPTVGVTLFGQFDAHHPGDVVIMIEEDAEKNIDRYRGVEPFFITFLPEPCNHEECRSDIHGCGPVGKRTRQQAYRQNEDEHRNDEPPEQFETLFPCQ